MERLLRLSPTSAIVLAALLSAPLFLAAQSTSSTAKTAAKDTASATKPADKKPWTLSRTPDGQPDIQGYWNSASFTPMERPAKFKGREFLTKEEMEQSFKAGVQHTYEFTFGNAAETPVYDSTTYGLDAWQNGIRPNPRSSLIVDPPDGRYPPLTPEAAKRSREMNLYSEVGDNGVAKADTPEDLGIVTQCLTFSGPPIVPKGYNNTTHIAQGPGYVLLEYEWGSEPRVIPLDAGPHLSRNMHQWNGDSRGHWEGDTLVIETTNFRSEATYQNTNADKLKITEYLRLIDKDTLEYKFTIDDPTTWTKPWTAIEPFSRIEGPMFEYACSEGNDGLVNIMVGARAAEKAAKEKPAGSPISQK